MLEEYFTKIDSLLKAIITEEKKAMQDAANLVSETIQNDGVIHLFGCGHSHILTEEVYYRAGGLVPIHPILHEPLMLHEGAIRSSTLERKNDYASGFMQKEDIRENDVIFVISTSGRNPVPIDVALIAKEKGVKVIVITSINYATSEKSRHKSGKYLKDVADLVIDNHAPIGDALMHYDKVEEGFGPSSTVIGASILQAILSEAIKQMADASFEPPILISGNVEGSDEHNKRVIDKYKDRVQL